MMLCPGCAGEKEVMDKDGYGSIALHQCETCHGTGSLTAYVDQSGLSIALETQTTDQIYEMLGKT